ncbi:MAG: hypothetical protein K6G18_03550 [Treponema sp.]|nr:hypothetical protein [Treponema sp.]
MLFVFFSATLFFTVFCGIGLLASRRTFFKVREGNFFLNFFTGFALIGVYFSLVQLFLPLTLWTLLPVLLVGTYGFFLHFREIRRRIAAAPVFSVLCLFFFYLIASVISNKGKIDAYDDFLYHASIVSWLNAYKVVPGLANLHFRLGMNSLYLQVAAGLDVGIWDKRSCSITVFLMYFSFLSYCLTGIHAAVRNPTSSNVRFAVCQAVMALWLFFTEVLEPYLNYDNPALVLIAVVISEMLPYTLAQGGKTDGTATGWAPAPSRTPWETVFLYSAASFAIKPMGAVAVFLVFTAAVFWKQRHKELSVLVLVKLTVLPLCILALFVVRNVIQTGYLMFPMTVFKLDLPWTLSKQLVDTNINAIQNYSRTIALGYEYVPGNGFWYWFIPWLKWVLREGNNILLPFVLLAGLVVAAVSLLRGRGDGSSPRASVPVKLAYYAYVIGNLLFCFITVPELRYDTVWIYGILAVALFFSPELCAGLAAVLRKFLEWGRKLAIRLAGVGRLPFALAMVFLLAVALLWIPTVREDLIMLGSVLARHELNAPHWQEEFKRWRRVFSVLAVILLCVVRLRPDGVRVPGKAGMVGKALGLLLAFVAVSCAFRNRNWLLPAAMYAMPVEKCLVSEEQPFYVYVALEGDQCGDAELPCTPEYCFTDRLRLFDINDMGKGFYIKKE